MITTLVKHLVRRRFHHAHFLIKRNISFKKTEKFFPVIKQHDWNTAGIDCFILGSDTLWNMDSENFYNSSEIFWGNTFKNNKIISYAPSVANTTLDTLKTLKFPKLYLNNLSYISVRDRYSKDVISQLTDKPVMLVCDPTLLLSADDYYSLKKVHNYRNYILLYTFEDLTSSAIEKVKQFAKEKGEKIISFANYYSWCDHTITATPANMISLFSDADYIITDTFHGTAFSMIFRKNFIVLDRGKHKVNDMLNFYSLETRIISEDENFLQLFEQKNIYTAHIETIFNTNKEKSIEFLKNAIAEK